MNDVRVAIKPIDIIMREEIPAEINENKIKSVKKTRKPFCKKKKLLYTYIFYILYTFKSDI